MDGVVAALGGFFSKVIHALGIGLMAGAMMSVFATLILIRVRAARTVKQACLMGVVAGSVIGLVLGAIDLFT